MSPHALAAPDQTARSLKKFGITRNAFIPDQTPLPALTNSYYEPWELIVQHLASSIRDHTLKSQVDRLPVLSASYLTGEAEWRRAYVVLCFLAHGYIWGGRTASEILPPPIAVPLLQVSSHLELPPVATYAALNLWNFSSTSSDFSDLDAIHALHTFTGTEDESWFYMISVAMETQAAHIIPVMMRALDAVKCRDYATMTDCLVEFSRCIRKVGVLLDRMTEKCDPMVFYHMIRPFLAGSKNMGAAGLPRGVFYDLGDGNGEWMQLRGGSNGQSSLIQFFDIVLGVEHTSEGNSNPHNARGEAEKSPAGGISFHEEVRGYMPGAHKRFLEHVSRMGSIRNLASLPSASTEQQEFREAFQTATRNLAEFRNKHLQIVTRYIIIPSRHPFPNSRVNLATASSKTMATSEKGDASADLKGTGGTALLPFLKQSRDETYRAGQFDDSN